MLCCTQWTMLCCTVNNVVLHPVNNVVLHPWVNNVVLPTTVWTIIILCCQLWTVLCCQLWTMLCCQLWTMLWTRLFSHKDNVLQHCLTINAVTTCQQLGWATMITIKNKLVLAILFTPVLTTVNNCYCFINAEHIVETIVNNIVHWTTLFSHDNRVVTGLFKQQWCNNFFYCTCVSPKDYITNLDNHILQTSLIQYLLFLINLWFTLSFGYLSRYIIIYGKILTSF